MTQTIKNTIELLVNFHLKNEKLDQKIFKFNKIKVLNFINKYQ